MLMPDMLLKLSARFSHTSTQLLQQLLAMPAWQW
jgi:hypothetical protein